MGYNREYYLANREKYLERSRQRRLEEPEKVKAEVNRKNKARWQKLKLKAIEVFGGRCVCCGEEGIEFLTLDHINNDGNEHRKEVSKIAFGIYGWLERHGYPKEGLQLLCWNCNMAKRANGGVCPHQTAEGSTTIAQASTGKRPEARGIER
ncbi:MAG: IceA protein [Podoviridae sp. ctQNx1]|nr:MAG: IceA protein [Podoviridae sp. ctQNx1]UOF78139.1 icea protein [Caudoviricetes sp.]